MAKLSLPQEYDRRLQTADSRKTDRALEITRTLMHADDRDSEDIVKEWHELPPIFRVVADGLLAHPSLRARLIKLLEDVN